MARRELYARAEQHEIGHLGDVLHESGDVDGRHVCVAQVGCFMASLDAKYLHAIEFQECWVVLVASGGAN